MATRRERQRRRKKKIVKYLEPEQPKQHQAAETTGILGFYKEHYKKLLLIPFILLLFAFLQIGVQYATTGSILHKGVSLQGGLTITVPVHDQSVTPDDIEELLAAEERLLVRGISEFGNLRGISIEIGTEAEGDALELLERRIIAQVSSLIPTAPDEYSVEIIGPALSQAFFQQTMRAVLIAFLLMGLVVFFYFGENWYAKIATTVLSIIASVLIFTTTSTFGIIVAILLALLLFGLYAKYSPPSAAVILAALSDIVITLAIINLFGVQLSTAGIAAFLMLIGYSVDTDILLSTRVLKQTGGTVFDRIVASARTGMTMTLTSMGASLIALLVSQSPTIKQIMLIIFIGLLIDIIITWLQNAGIIRWYAEARQ